MSKPAGRLQKEIKQTRPFRSVAQEATLGLMRTADVMRRHMAGLIEPQGITAQQYNVLRILRGAGPEGLPTLEIADRMIERAPGITRLLDRLEVKRLVQRERCPTDRRQVTCRITRQGLALLEAMDPVINQADVDLVGSLDQGEQRELVRLLDRLRRGLTAQA